METCDVLIAGGGPAGAACAWKLRQAGLDVIVMDKAIFPRDKVCAGWITPQVVDDLQIDPDDYRHGRTFQPITAFRVGIIGAGDAVDVGYNRPVSYGIRRCEFDDYLLRRSNARFRLGVPVARIRRVAAGWVVNESITASMLVGAGGHVCPVARMLNGRTDRAPLVAAQEVEFAVDPREASAFAAVADTPELYFTPDLKGYGWCLRKQTYLNIGFGRVDAHQVPKATAGFVDYLKTRRVIPAAVSWGWRGHAYLVSSPVHRRAVGDAVVLIGDAAGIAYPQSGEGIRPAVESGLMAASTVIDANGQYTRDRLEPYQRRLQNRFGIRPIADVVSRAVPDGLSAAVARRCLASPWFVRHVVLDRWFLHAHEPPVSAASAS